MVGYYKSSKADFNVAIRIALTGEMSIDTGGIRRQAYTQVYSEFAQNKHIHLFDGPTNLLRPVVSASARSSGVMKILGKMISHSMYQDDIGFPYLSAVCYWEVRTWQSNISLWQTFLLIQHHLLKRYNLALLHDTIFILATYIYVCMYTYVYIYGTSQKGNVL